MKFNDPTEVKIEKTEKKVEKESQKETVTEESAEEKKNLTTGEIKDAILHNIKGFYTVKDKKLRVKRILITCGELVLVYLSGMFSVSSQPAKLFGVRDYSFFHCISSFFSFNGILAFVLINAGIYFGIHWLFKKAGREDYTISKNGTYGTAKLLNGTEEENEAVKRIPVSKLSDPEIDGNILGYIEETNEVIIKDVHGNANRNIAVCGGPGTGKSRTLVRNIIFQCVRRGESIFITDPKGEMAESMAKYLKNNGYIVKYYNLKNFEASDSFNCLQGLNNEEGHAFINVLADIIMKNTASMSGSGGNANAALNLLIALMLFVVIQLPEEKQNMVELYNLITLSDPKSLDALFDGLDATHPAKKPYRIYAQASENFRSNITADVATRLLVYAQEGVQNISIYDEIDLTLPGKEKCAYFIITPDQNSAYDFMASLFQAVAYNKLVKYADDIAEGGILPVKVQMLLDEFPNIGEIPDFGKKISTVRSRGIATTIIFQAITQMQNRYPNGLWEEILAACDTSLFLGCNDETSAKYYSEKTGIGTIEVGTQQKSLKTLRVTDYTPEVRQSEGEGKRYVKNPDELLRFKYQDELIFCKGFNAFQCNKFDYELHPEAKNLEYEKAIEHVPEWRLQEEPYKLFVLRYIPGTPEFDRKAFPKAGSENAKEDNSKNSDSKKKANPSKPPKDTGNKNKKDAQWRDFRKKKDEMAGQQAMNYSSAEKENKEKDAQMESRKDAGLDAQDFNEPEDGDDGAVEQGLDYGDTSGIESLL